MYESHGRGGNYSTQPRRLRRCEHSSERRQTFRRGSFRQLILLGVTINGPVIGGTLVRKWWGTCRGPVRHWFPTEHRSNRRSSFLWEKLAVPCFTVLTRFHEFK